jgi:hypothetical protein
VIGAIKGAAQMTALLQKFVKEYPDRIASALYMEAQIMMTESKRRCPIAPDGGTLRASGQVSEPVRQGKCITVWLSYGGAATAYAIAVHEHLSEHSPPSWKKAEAGGEGVHWTEPGTGPKFLESVINEAEATIKARLAARLQLGGS